MNRVGDVGLAIAIFLMFAELGTRQLRPRSSRGVGELSGGARRWRSGCCCCSAPAASPASSRCRPGCPDAMEGPTPVSALIHAATMVTAGVYLIARSNPIYDLTETARSWSSRCIGALTLLIGCDHRLRLRRHQEGAGLLDGQPDRLHVPRPSGSAPAGYALAIVHLLAHGFFKAGLFLGAGSVMHAMNDQVDMRRFGGLCEVHADHLRDVRAGLPRAHRLPVPVRLLHQGRDHRGRVRPRRAGSGWLFGGAALLGRRAHRLLHDPAVVHDVLRPRSGGPRTSTTRTSRRRS